MEKDVELGEQREKKGEKEMCMIKNEMGMEFDAISLNESLARMVVASFIMPLNQVI